MVLAVSGCGGRGASASAGGDSPTLTLYNGQHESTTKLLVADFTKATGIKVQVRSGEDPELANQILQEGAASPADVFYTENSPALELLSEKGKLAKVDPATLAPVPSQFDSPQGDWVGVAGREAVLVYNSAKLPAAEIPGSLLDIGGPPWRGQVGIAPAGADFQAIVAGVVALEGKQKASAWLHGLKRVAQTYQSNSAILQAVNRGDIPAGIIYHYYFFRDQAESGANSGNVKLHYFGQHDPGAFVSVSGAGVLASSRHQAAAQRFLQFLTGVQGQTDLANSEDFEYPLNPKVPANPVLKPFDELQPPDVGPAQVGDGREAVALLQQAGLL
ncbi:MAG: iron ABC transporter substrate-binding protein [Motilibacteraceae bacterium]